MKIVIRLSMPPTLIVGLILGITAILVNGQI
jgi:hypothetical protein